MVPAQIVGRTLVAGSATNRGTPKRGLVGWEILPLALLLSVPYGLGIVLGQRWFHPDREKLYRSLAYSVIAGAILTGLPLFDR